MNRTSSRLRALAVGAVVPTLFVGLVGATPAQATPTPTFASAVAAEEEAAAITVDFVGQTPQAGQPVTATAYNLTPTDATVSYLWTVRQDDGTEAPATGQGFDTPTYTPTGSDAGHTLTVTATASADGYSPATNSYSDIVQTGYQDYESNITLDGSSPARVGQKITVTGLKTTAPDATFTYRWARWSWNAGRYLDIPGETHSSYTPTQADLNNYVAVFINAKAEGFYDSETAWGVNQVQAALPFSTTISGDPRIGQTLTAEPTFVPEGATLSYQWLESTSDSDGAISFINIDGATDATFTVDKASYVGKQIKVAVTAAGDDNTQNLVEAEVGPVAKGTLDVPRYVVTGDAIVGKTATVHADGDVPDGADITYQWSTYDAQADTTTPIDGATDSSYTFTADDINKIVAVSATATQDGYEDVTQTVITGRVSLGTFGHLPDVSISGTPAVDSEVAVELDGTESLPEGTTTEYQWSVNGDAIEGATTGKYTPTASQALDELAVTVTFKKDGYETETADRQVGLIALGEFSLASDDVTIEGATEVGKTVTATSVIPSDDSIRVSYQWYRDSNGDRTAIDGATSVSYTLTEADKTVDGGVDGVKVYVSYQKDGYSPKVLKSDVVKVTTTPVAITPTPTPAPAPAPVPAPKPTAEKDYVKVNDSTLRRGQKVYVTSGYAKPGSTFKIVIAGRTVYTGKVHSNGQTWNWVTVPKAASKGKHLVQVAVYDSLGKRVDTDRAGITVR